MPVDLSKPVSRKLFAFKTARFWGSPDFVLGITIIAHVLTNPDTHDLDEIASYFGVEALERVLSILESKKEIHAKAKAFREDYINTIS